MHLEEKDFMKLLMVGGTFDNNGGKPSGLFDKLRKSVIQELDIQTSASDPKFVECDNGGFYDSLKSSLESSPNFNVILWMANVPNDLPKIREVKEIAPKCIYINSKRNDIVPETGKRKYTEQELINRSLGVKANLTIEFTKTEAGVFTMRLFDPLGDLWYEGTDIKELSKQLVKRLLFLRAIERKGTLRNARIIDKKPIMEMPEIQEFVKIVKDYAIVFHNVIQPAADVKRFLGNASLRPDLDKFRCTKGFPSFRCPENLDYAANLIFVTKRNVNKETLSADDFIPVWYTMEKGIFFYEDYAIENVKPSVDTPIQMELYANLPNINFMIHSHCYIKNAPFTKVPIPCGGLQEIDEVLSTLEREYGSLEKDFYVINLIGHGNIVMAKNVEQLRDIDYYGRTIFEKM